MQGPISTRATRASKHFLNTVNWPKEWTSEKMAKAASCLSEVVDSQQLREAPKATSPLGPNTTTIDISPWLDEDAPAGEREKVVARVLHAAVTSGSFSVTGHGVPEHLLLQARQRSREFFEQPLERKAACAKGTMTGYVGFEAESANSVYGREGCPRDQREVFGVVTPFEDSRNVTDGMDEHFLAVTEAYSRQLDALDAHLHDLLTAALALAKGLSGTLPPDHLQAGKGQAGGLMRFINYPTHGEAGLTRLPAHSDWGTLTILHGEGEGLEELHGEAWAPVTLQAGAFHIILGDMMHAWSNGLFPANVHRVAPREAAESSRLSIAYFSGQAGNGQPVALAPVCGRLEDPRFKPVGIHEYVSSNLQLLAGRQA